MTDNVSYLGTASALPAREDRDWVTSQEIAGDTGITYRQLDYWTRTDLVIPVDVHLPGSGHLRRYHVDQLPRVHALHDLLQAGVSLQTCRHVLDEFAATGHVTVGRITISRTGGSAA